MGRGDDIPGGDKMNHSSPEYNRRYYREHKAEHRERRKRWCLNNPDRAKEMNHKWYNKHYKCTIKRSKLRDPKPVIDETVLGYIHAEDRLRKPKCNYYGKCTISAAVREYNSLLNSITMANISWDL